MQEIANERTGMVKMKLFEKNWDSMLWWSQKFVIYNNEWNQMKQNNVVESNIVYERIDLWASEAGKEVYELLSTMFYVIQNKPWIQSTIVDILIKK